MDKEKKRIANQKYRDKDREAYNAYYREYYRKNRDKILRRRNAKKYGWEVSA